jgi:predicted NBD/HSP70 family sugar kinase
MTGDERLLEALLWDGLLRQSDSSQPPLTQEELAERTGLSRNSIKAYVSTKLKRVLERDGSPSLRPTAAYALGVDFGRTHEVRVILTDLRGRWDQVHGMSPREDEFTEGDPGAWEIINNAVDRIWKVMSDHEDGPLDPRRLVGVGIGIPTPSAPGGSPMVSAYGHWGQWGDAGPMLKEALERRWQEKLQTEEAWKGVEFVEENDTNLSAIADHLWGSGPSSNFSLFVKWQSSVRASLILDGRLYTGSKGVAGELPHVKVEGAVGTCDSRYCPAGEGCLYAIAPIEKIEEIAHTRRAEEIVELASRDQKVRDHLVKAAEGIGQAVAPLALGVNPEKVVIGGALGGRAYPLVLEALREGVDSQARITDFLVTSSTIRNRGTVRGAAALALLELGTGYLKQLALAPENGGGRRKAPARPRRPATTTAP